MITGTPGLPGMTIAGASADEAGTAPKSDPATAIITHASERMERSTANTQSRGKVTHEQSNATSPGRDICAVALTLDYRPALGWGASISAASQPLKTPLLGLWWGRKLPAASGPLSLGTKNN